MESMLKPYLKNLYEISSRGDAREESFYSALEGLLEEYAESRGKRNIHVTTLPKNTEALKETGFVLCIAEYGFPGS